MKFTPQHKTAICYPAKRAEACVHHRYSSAFVSGPLKVTTLLTVNVGEE